MLARSCLLLGCLLILAACRPDASERREHQGFGIVDTPAGAPSGQPRLMATERGLLMSWVETSDGGAALRYAWYREGRWGAPAVAATGEDWFVNWADTPGVLALPDGRLLAFYLQRTGPQPFAYGIRVITSEDGQTWTPPLVPHQDGLPVEYGFVSTVAHDDGSVRLVWLDGTQMYTGEEPAGHGHGGPMTLRSAVLTPAGHLQDAALLDERVCECCPTAAVAIPGGALIAYRDRSPEEVRDIAVVRIVGGRASPPVVPHPDGWTIAGCPVNGPAAVARGERVVVAWYSGARGGEVRVMFSDDAGASFTEPQRVDDGAPVGRVDLAMLDDGEVAVIWLENTEAGGELRARRVSADGTERASITVAPAGPDRATGMPKAALYDGWLWASWVDVEARAVRVARARLSELP